MVEWTEEGIRYEYDQRHADIIVQSMGLTIGAKGVLTPAAKRESDLAIDETNREHAGVAIMIQKNPQNPKSDP